MRKANRGYEKERNDMNKIERFPTGRPKSYSGRRTVNIVGNNSLRWPILSLYDYGQTLVIASIKLSRRTLSRPLVNVCYSGRDNGDDADAAVTPCQPRYTIRDSTITIIRPPWCLSQTESSSACGYTNLP